ncbi:MAG: amidohydrolase family protein [Parvibaculaceae bacterium]
MPSQRLLITGALVVDTLNGTSSAADILVEGGRIAEVRPGGIEAGEGVRRFDGRGQLVMPGLVNAHTHGHGSLGKGLGDLWSLELLLNASGWASAGFGYEACYVSALLNAAEMIRKGVTSCYDLFVQIPTPDLDALDAAAQGYLDAGMRVVLAPMMADRTFYDAVPGLMAVLPEQAQSKVRKLVPRTHDEQLAVLRRWMDGWRHDRDRVRPALCPTIPTHCTRPFLEGCRDLARDFDVGIQMHLAESKPQAVAGLKVFGKTLASYLDELGLLGPRFTGAHCVWLDEEDLTRMADTGSRIAHNPGSNLRLGCGIAPSKRMLDKAIPVGIGTDGSVSADHQNMFEAVRLASYVSRATSPDPADWISAPQALRMATAGGAEVLGFGEHIGRIAPGAYADLVFLDLANVTLVPLNDAVRQLVQCEDSSAVSSVMVGGHFVLERGRFTTFDYPALRGKAQAAAERLIEMTREKRQFAEAIEPIVAQHCVGLAKEPYHVHRYCGCAPSSAL